MLIFLLEQHQHQVKVVPNYAVNSESLTLLVILQVQRNDLFDSQKCGIVLKSIEVSICFYFFVLNLISCYFFFSSIFKSFLFIFKQPTKSTTTYFATLYLNPRTSCLPGNMDFWSGLFHSTQFQDQSLFLMHFRLILFL